MSEQKFKRNVAYKLRIGDLLIGKPVMNAERFQFLELGDKKIVRVNIVGNIIDKYESDGEKKYIFFTIDDGSGQMQLKAFGDDVDKFKEVHHGDTVLVIGVLRHWNDNTYIGPEIIREQNPKYLLLRKLELEKVREETAPKIKKEEILALKDRIINMIKESEKEETGGIEVDKIILEIRDASPEIIKQEIQKLLEEGIVFEPRPGKVRYLG